MFSVLKQWGCRTFSVKRHCKIIKVNLPPKSQWKQENFSIVEKQIKYSLVKHAVNSKYVKI